MQDHSLMNQEHIAKVSETQYFLFHWKSKWQICLWWMHYLIMLCLQTTKNTRIFQQTSK
jgi:hypothetical protein